MIIKECTKCKSVKLVVVKNSSHLGLYCVDCGAWIKWISKKEYPIYEKLREERNG